MAMPTCGDGHLDTGEECDGSSLGPATCASLGFDTGTLTCGADCKLITGGCTRRCGNATLETGEACDGTLGVTPCASFGYASCSAACSVDNAHCVVVPFTQAPSLTQPKGGPAVIADLSPKGLGDLVMVLRDATRLATFPYTVAQGFVSDRMISVGQYPWHPAAADVTGDGFVDLAAINQDGTADRYVFNGNGYSLEPLPSPDGGCGAAYWLPSGRTEPDAGTASLIAFGCIDTSNPGPGFTVWPGGATPRAPLTLRHPTSFTVATAADVNGDGLFDLINVQASSMGQWVATRYAPDFTQGPADLPLPLVPASLAAADFDGDNAVDFAAAQLGGDIALLQNTGAALAPHGTFTSAEVDGLAAADLDLDGRVDLVWFDGATSKIQIRRNTGNWAFAPFELTVPAGTFLSLAVGDADGDADGDLALSLSTGTTSTVTAVFINKVR